MKSPDAANINPFVRVMQAETAIYLTFFEVTLLRAALDAGKSEVDPVDPAAAGGGEGCPEWASGGLAEGLEAVLAPVSEDLRNTFINMQIGSSWRAP